MKYITARSAIGILEISGPDSAAFLQGQLTCDAKQLAVGSYIPGALCNVKGRTLANFDLYRRSDDTFLMLLPLTQIQPVISRLKMYVLRSRLILVDVTDKWRCYGLVQYDDIQVLWPSGNAFELMRTDQKPARCLHITSIATESDYLDQAYSAGWKILEAEDTLWDKLDIMTKQVVLDSELSDRFTPQMLNLDQSGAVSFKKGCYTGQEIIARTHYLGEAKRRLFQLHATASSAELKVGAPLLDKAGATLGTIIQTCDQEILAVVHLEAKNSPLALMDHTPVIIRV